jgi:hypothetical protein
LAINDNFGYSVSMSGNYAIIGAPFKTGPGAEVKAGAAYIYERDGAGTWLEKPVLRASNLTADDRFGSAVAISGDYAIVGAPLQDASGGTNRGAAYIFERNLSGSWNQTPVLYASDQQDQDQFGCSVALSGTFAIVGAYREDGGSTDPSPNAGAAYIFERNISGVWEEKAILHASTMSGNEYFGYAVAVDGSYAIVGAYADGISGNTNAGAAYIFEQDGSGTWAQKPVLTASDSHSNDYFGRSVAISGNRAVIGAPQEDGGLGDPLLDSGAVYVFERNGSGNWIENPVILHASNAGANDWFGCAVALSGDLAVLGAFFEDGGTGDPLPDCGAAYAFKREAGGGWTENFIIRASDAQTDDLSGFAVAANGTYAVIGAYQEDGGSGNPFSNSGAAYIRE